MSAVKYHYLYDDKDRKPVATMAVSGLFFGVAVCSEKDQFEKEIGRRIALDRLNKYGYYVPKFRDRKIVDTQTGFKEEISLRDALAFFISDVMADQARWFVEKEARFNERLEEAIKKSFASAQEAQQSQVEQLIKAANELMGELP